MKVAFVSGPYRADTISQTVQNIRIAESVAQELWQLGWCALCPHLNTALFDGLCDDSVWLKGDLELLRRSDALVRLPKWRNSTGAVAEHDLARELGLEVYQWRADRGDRLEAV